MEIDGLGARCHLPSCNRLDYLPFKCGDCGQTFCTEHQLPTSHQCTSIKPSITIPQCPICQRPVSIPPGRTPDFAISQHIDQGCPKRKRQFPVCAMHSCNVRDPAATKCVACAQMFCLKHRIESQHDCQKRPVVQGVFGNGAGKMGGAGNAGASAMAAVKKARMKMKWSGFANTPQTAIGDAGVDVEQRITMAVFLPPEANVQPTFMYFSRRQSPGRIIDALRKRYPSIPSASGGGRYYLYAVKKGMTSVNLLPYVSSLGDLKLLVEDGGALVLQQGDAGLDEFWLNTLEKYMKPSVGVVKRGRKFGRGRSADKSSDKCIIV